jgi:hypothetical protein
MADPSPSSLLDKLVGWCFAILLAAMALYGAVLLIQCIWPWLVIGLAVVGAVILVGWLVIRWRHF